MTCQHRGRKPRNGPKDLRLAGRELAAHDNHRPLDPISISAGVASFPQHGATVSSLLQAADAALYPAKTAGRDRGVVAP